MVSRCLSALLFVFVLSSQKFIVADDQSLTELFPLDVGCE